MTADRPLVVFDGECGFCTLAALWLLRRLCRPVEVQPWQALDLDAIGLSASDVRRWAWWIDLDGARCRGHRAAARSLQSCGALWPWIGRLLLLPPISWLAALGYRLVARSRRWLPGVTPACRRPEGWPP